MQYAKYLYDWSTTMEWEISLISNILADLSMQRECPPWVYSVEKLETLKMPYFY